MSEGAILTPPTPRQPRLNGATIYGARGGSPFLYRIPATGDGPLTFAAEGLPQGLALDPATGIISGVTEDEGTHRVGLTVRGKLGSDSRVLRVVIGDTFSLTPPLGCNTYGGWGKFVDERNIRDSARAMIASGLAGHGYCYVNIDDGWQGYRGGPYHAILPNEKFGDMKQLGDDLHAQGLKFGLYSTPWTTSYENFVGGSSDEPGGGWTQPKLAREGHRHGAYCFAEADAKQVAEWGCDYFKYDWKIDLPSHASRMGDALAASGRDIVYELSNDAPLALAEAFTAIGTMCRTTGDIVDVWDKSQLDEGKRRWALGVRDIWLQHRDWQRFNRPGHWNMPCPLRVGLLGGWDRQPLRPSRLTIDEQYTHVSLWALWASPIIIGCPLETLDAFTLSLLRNDEVLAVNQDALGLQGTNYDVEGGEAIVKELEDGSWAVGLFNVAAEPGTVTAGLRDLGLAGPLRVRDIWRQQDLEPAADRLTSEVAGHGVRMVTLRRP